MRTLWPKAAITVAVLLTSGVGARCLAAEGTVALHALAGTMLSTKDLARYHARGIVIGSALSDGTLTGNTLAGSSITGTITNTNSINSNAGITTIFQNTGNNSLFQQSTSIFITLQ